MSHAPQSEDNAESMLEANSAFRLHLERLNELIRDGGTLSGHERNCAFLNTRRGRFANVSAVSGLDFPDDARAVAVVDWDRDGKLDVWVTNRTGPLVRFLRNNSPGDSRFMAVELRGTSCNRDAVGARVEVVLAASADGTPAQPLIKTLHAGEGFLGQSSKWLHFGLGEDGKVEVIRVRWPGGDWEEFTGATVDGWFRLVQGRGVAEAVQRPAAATNLVASPLAPSSSAAGRVVLSAPIPVPALRYQAWNGAEQEIPLGSGRPVVLNLWASWCEPCVAELAAWSSKHESLRAAGLEVVALSADELDETAEGSRAAARDLVDGLDLPFASGLVTAELYRRLEQLSHWPFQRRIPMAVPTTFLLDAQGRLAAIYRGPVEPEDLLADVRLLTQDESSFRAASLPFAGRWETKPRPQRPIQTAIQLMDRGDVADAAAFVRRNYELLAPHREFALLATWIGDQFSALGRTSDSLTFYEMAVRRDPNDLTVMNNLAWQLAANPADRVRRPEAAVEWAEKAAAATHHANPHVLDTLAVAYASAGRFEDAVRVARRAQELALREGKGKLAEALTERIKLFESQKAYLDPRNE